MDDFEISVNTEASSLTDISGNSYEISYANFKKHCTTE